MTRHMLNKLRGRLAEQGKTQRELAIRIDRSQKWVSDIFTGKAEPDLTDMWKIMDVLQIDAGDMAIYFPRR